MMENERTEILVSNIGYIQYPKLEEREAKEVRWKREGGRGEVEERRWRRDRCRRGMWSSLRKDILRTRKLI